MDVVENLAAWQEAYAQWVSLYRENGRPDWTKYPFVRNRTAPAGPGIDLAHSRLMLISTAGGYLKDEQEPFDAANKFGDYSIRRFPVNTPFERLAFAHEHYDHTAVNADPQVLLPLQHLAAMVEEGDIGELAPSVISYSGYMPDMSRLVRELVPVVLAAARAEKPDGVLLVPA